jgi:hypothetical protein
MIGNEFWVQLTSNEELGTLYAVFVDDIEKAAQKLGPTTRIYLVETWSIDGNEVLWGRCLRICEPSGFGIPPC